MYRLTKHRGEDDNFLRFTVFLIRDANFVEINHQFGTCEPCPSCAPRFVWMTTSECRRTKEFTNPRVDLIFNWEVEKVEKAHRCALKNVVLVWVWNQPLQAKPRSPPGTKRLRRGIS
jgi:hypothetical protein